MDNFNKVQACFDENACTLITPFEEFEELRKTVRKQYYQYVRVRFIGTCSHESSVVFTNFYLRKTGMNCKACTKKNSIELRKKSGQTNSIETDGNTVIEEYLSPLYEVKRTKEGCLADMAIRKKTEKEDKWIPVQVKATIKNSHGMYSFRLNNIYKNMLLICVCITEKKLWILPYNYLDIQYKLNISTKSKYSKYLVDTTTTIDQYLSEIEYMNIERILLPSSPFQKREQEYVKKREGIISFLRYEYPVIQNTCVDVIVNGKKVQEKVLGYTTPRNEFHCGMSVNMGKSDGIQLYRTYRLGENDYYWLHSSIDERFWIIPERVLYEKGYLSDRDETKKRKTLRIAAENEKHWLHSYQYCYDTLDKDKIIKIFG